MSLLMFCHAVSLELGMDIYVPFFLWLFILGENPRTFYYNTSFPPMNTNEN